jgi:hypothetical protein
MTKKERKALADNSKYQIGDVIQINIEKKGVPGIKDLKPGKYRIIDFRRSLMRVEYHMVYEFVSTRSNSSYKFVFSQEFIEPNSNKIDKIEIRE